MRYSPWSTPAWRSSYSEFLSQFCYDMISAATEGADEVPAERLVDALLTLEHASLEEHLRITFELLDTRGDGSIARENMVEILKVGAFGADSLRTIIPPPLPAGVPRPAVLCRQEGCAQPWT